MSIRQAIIAMIGVLMVTAPSATAQQRPTTQTDSTEAQLRTTLRAFYFSLAHRDWATLTTYILPAKVVAHRAPPETLVDAAKLRSLRSRPAGTAPDAGDPPTCSAHNAALVDQAIITLDGDWAEVSVPRYAETAIGADEFRFIHFDGRWWIVHIDLFRCSLGAAEQSVPA